MILQQNSVKQIFNPHAFFFFLLAGATWYYNVIYIIFTYFASFTGYEDDIYEVISNLHVQGSKFGGKFEKFGGKSFLKMNSVEFMEFVFPKSVVELNREGSAINRANPSSLSCYPCYRPPPPMNKFWNKNTEKIMNFVNAPALLMGMRGYNKFILWGLVETRDSCFAIHQT